MAFSFVAYATVRNGWGGTASVNMPTGTTAGDVMVACAITQYSGASHWTAPEGWTAIGHSHTPAAAAWYRVATTGEAGPYAFTAPDDTLLAGITTYRSSIGAPSIDATNEGGAGGGVGITVGALTSAGASELDLIWLVARGSVGSWTYPGGWTVDVNAPTAAPAVLGLSRVVGAGDTGTAAIDSAAQYLKVAARVLLIEPAAGNPRVLFAAQMHCMMG